MGELHLSGTDVRLFEDFWELLPESMALAELRVLDVSSHYGLPLLIPTQILTSTSRILQQLILKDCSVAWDLL